ncbi:restin homolog isoform X2 [Periplaneta americana]|uniref:restin homolog isoform X2 n=1 Tax=Periplaneta americana TaxID=6978 RepID=UPI0037E8C253
MPVDDLRRLSLSRATWTHDCVVISLCTGVLAGGPAAMSAPARKTSSAEQYDAAPGESRIPVFRNKPTAPSLPIRNAFAGTRSEAALSQNEKPTKRPSSLLELFNRNKVGALPVTAAVRPMSAKASVVRSEECPHPPKNCRIADLLDDDTWQPNATSSPTCDVKEDASGPVTTSHVGHRVCVGGTKVGILRYFGEIQLSSGVFCGIELDEPVGLNDGSVQGVRYFTCKPNHGIIAPVDIVRTLPRACRRQSLEACSRRSATVILDESGPFSLLDCLPTDAEQMDKNGDPPNDQMQSSPAFTPTTSSTTSNTETWACWNQHPPLSQTRHHQNSLDREGSLDTPELACSLSSSQQGSFDQDDSLGILPLEPTSPQNRHQQKSFEQESNIEILTLDQLSPFGCSQLRLQQNSFDQDSTLGILAIDQLSPFCCSQVRPQQNSFEQEILALDPNCAFSSTQSRNSLDQDENSGVLTPERTCSQNSSQPRYQPQHLAQEFSKQSSFELDESLGILTPDQMVDFTVCAESPSVGRTPSFEDMAVFLLGEYKTERVEDMLPDRLSSESDGPSSNYPSSEFAHFPVDVTENSLKVSDETQSTEKFLISKVENVSLQELELLSNDVTPDQQRCVPNQVLELNMCCVSEELSDNICPGVSKSSDGEFTPASIRVGQDISDRTLSPEDLPMDAPFQEVIGEILQKAEMTSESGHDTAGVSGATSAGPSSRSSAAPPAPSSFVTSVTSITSLDNGYQGDGEWSRPASRGADHSPTSQRVLKLKTSAAAADPMTDSDFFTESDADMHDELAAGSGRGDRRAQVIDGTLYGANLHAGGAVLLGHQHQRCPSFTASINEEMESSGVYSDLERRPEDPASDGKEFQVEERGPVEADFSPDGSTKTVSSHSEQSQVKDSDPAFTIIPQTGSETTKDLPVAMDTNEFEETLVVENNSKNHQAVIVVNQMAVATDAENVCLERQSQHKTEVTAPAGNKPATQAASANSKSSKEEGHHTLKKYKMPKRNVVSKIKAMIESPASTTRGGGSASTEDENQENRRPSRSPSKSLRKNGGRWDAVMNKIAQGQAEQKMKTRSLKEVKSKVFANLTPSSSQPSRNGDRTRKTSSSSLGASALKENSPLKAKSRRARTRASSTSLSQQQQSPGNGAAPGRVSSPNSSPHSSISDVSVNQSQVGKASTKSSSSLRSSKKRDVGRSTSPLSDGSTNSTTSHVMTRSSSNHLPPLSHHTRPPGHISAARDRILRDNVNRNSGANLQKQRQTRSPRELQSNTGSARRAASLAQEKNGVNVTAVVDMKTPPTRKQASRRNIPNSGQKPTPLRDHNRQQQAGGGGVFKPGSEAPPSNKPGEVSVLPQRPSPAPQPNPVEILLPELRHNAAGFEALGVLVQYLVYNLDAFSTPHLRKDLESMKTEWLKTKLELEEAQVSYRRVEDNLNEEKLSHHHKLEEVKSAHHCELTARDTKHSREIAELVARHEAQLSDFEKRLQEQLEEMKGRYEAELSRTDEQNAEKLKDVIADREAHVEKLQREHTAVVDRLQSDASQREDELRRRLTSVEEECSGLKDQSRKLMDSMQKDKDTKLQATAGRCKELQDEVESLRTVLDLRHEELQELRKQNAILIREAEELPIALQRVAALEAKVEDLQVQLQMKTNLERQLSQDNRLLMESFHQESKQNKRLSLHNEELQWKLKQNLEVVNVLAALSGASMNSSMTSSLHTPATNGRKSTHGSVQSLNDADPSSGGNQLFSTRTHSRPLSAGRLHNSSGTDLSSNPTGVGRSNLGEDLEISPPASPKVKGVVEKSDSVSWVVEIDESPEALLSRLVRRAGSFRGNTPPPSSVPSPAHARTLPPPKRQRCKASSLSLSSSATAIARPATVNQSRNTPLSSSLRSRSRSVSTDSVDDMVLDYDSWNPPTSTPLKNDCRAVGNLECDDAMVVLMNSNKTSLKRSGDEVYVNDNHEDVIDGCSPSIRNLSGVSNISMKRSTSECSNEEDSQTKSPGSSASSDGGQKDHDHSCCRSRKKMSGNLTDAAATSDSLDLGDTEVLPLPPLPGSTSGDLSLLAAQPLPPMPKESAGEAMISEETSDDDNDNEYEINSSSDERSCSEDEETSSY